MSQRALGRQFRRTGDVFPRVSGPLSTSLGIYAGHAGTQEFEPTRLIATQKRLNPQRVQHYVDNPDSEPIEVMRWDEGRGPAYIFDGHHRAAAAKIRGEKISATVRTV